MKTQGGSCRLTSKWEFCLACLHDHTHKSVKTHMHKYHTCICSESCFMSRNYCICPHLYITLFSTSSLCTHHSQLTSRIPAGAAYLKLPISISSSRHAASPGSLFPAGIQHWGAPSQPRAGTRLLRHCASSPSPPAQRACFPANALPALDYLLFTRIPAEPAPACSDPP